MIDKITALFKRFTDAQFIRFLLVAGLNTAFGWCIFALLRFLFGLIPHIDPLFWATLLGTIISVLFNFKTYGHLVFRNKDPKLIFRFVMVYTITYFINYFSIYFLDYCFGINNYVGALIMALPVGLLNYFFNKIFVYSKDCKRWLWHLMLALLIVEILFFIYLKLHNPS
ncbi:MAG: GtrA family protein [Bacteroidales bacterium]|nr:GtrA family protein [Bacteroidales bacterium]MBR6160833.1 GtrA family protein [Bacteroidales bacterium]